MTTIFPRRSLALVLALAAPLGLLACSDDEPERANVRSESAAADDPSNELAGGDAAEQAPDDEGDAPEGDSSGGATSGSRDEVLASADGALPSSPSGETVPLRVDVNGIRRTSGDLVEVLFAITNDGDVDLEPYSTMGGSVDATGTGYDVGGAALLDAPNDKRYLVVYDTNGSCLCTEGLSSLTVAPGATVPFSATFPAPPEDVTEVGFSLPGFDPIDALEIS